MLRIAGHVGGRANPRPRVGAGLIAGAETEARRLGCALVVFHAYDVLARGLYERLGYETVGVIEDCPVGTAARWFRKDL